ncbi:MULTISPECIES: PP2C family protein-serine/threonine phosphatase [Xanthomonas]|uniref:Serine/threonine protein phosphatase PrpC n=1 Tax=Xanthomonas euvesicatoria TaxID=456327 RepID=A0AAW3U945_XANEU|nr:MULTISPECIES: protein phosphatase 2C domain-containing protein [Xanthomonas]MBB4725245.1 serine/threonine protein phosphatase PrpC [Xanthomonas euvesicatoria]MBB4871837.1 serine/threonine protein phosphatase PrpC [Xanthomonas euvesicatoria]MBV6851280.1 hypothetical protein [Xanthomonas campestris pv. heliotropii]
MHPFQENLQTWLSRRMPSHVSNQSADLPFILSSDIGLVRKENQDRVAALYTGKKSINPLLAIVVADGMGGMRDGGRCATLAVSSFFHHLIQYRNLDIKVRAAEAIKASNGQVFSLYHGGGGSTLTAFLLDSHGAQIVVHLGDTRIYTFGVDRKVERHTVDDSLVEAVGGSGRELLQFVGMGDSMQPQVSDLGSLNGFCAITTDGIHGIEGATLNQILANSHRIDQASERLNSVAKWCGGRDNATSAIFDMAKMSSLLAQYDGSGIRIWDAGGDLTALWLREEDQAFNVKQARGPGAKESEEKPSPRLLDSDCPDSVHRPKKINPSVKKSRKKKAKGDSEDIQLDIQIGNSEGQGESGANSK